MQLLERVANAVNRVHPQKVVNAVIVLIGLAADLIALGLFFGVLHTPVEGSNFYVNSREFLAWVLMAIIYSVGLLNAWVRRRWRRTYGTRGADHSVLNLFYVFDLTKGAAEDRKIRNWKRDFSYAYVVMFPITFLYARAVAASTDATGITPSPWGDVVMSALITVPVALGTMIVTSMFDFTMSLFKGDDEPEQTGVTTLSSITRN